jgi:hypothetical protein
MAAVLASLFSALMGRPADAERWADAVDHWQYEDPAGADDPSAEAWAALLRAICAGGGPNGCAPTRTRPCAGSRQGAL